MQLAEQDCVPCKGGVPPYGPEQIGPLMQELDGWKAESNHHLTRSYDFPDFMSALAFTNRIGELAEEQGHHPDIMLSWGKVKLTIWTHAIDGLSQADFVLAAKIDRLPRAAKPQSRGSE
jgi:4a-hydroxytetrahydrobiopterin dehydratase